MATSGSKTVKLYTNTAQSRYFDLIFSWSRIDYSVEDNTSTIEWSLALVNESINLSAASRAWTVKVDSQTYSGSYTTAISRYTTTTLTSGTTEISHTVDGTKSFSCSFSFDLGFGYGTMSDSDSAELDTIPRPATITSAEDFNDEESPTIYYNNLSGSLVTALDACISFTGAKDDIPYRAVSKTDGYYTFDLTDTERTTLRKEITSGGSTTVRFYLRTTIGSYVSYSYLSKTLTLVNHEPTLSPTVVDTNTRTVSLTGDNNKLIRYYSNATFTTGAAAQKEATITSQYVTNGAQTVENTSSGTINGVESNTFYFGVTDSRGYQTKDFLVKDLIPYVKLTNNIRQTVLTFNGDLTFIIGGKFFNGSFGTKSNTLEVEFSLKDENGDVITNPSGSGWQPLGTVTPRVDIEGNYTFEYTISGLNHEMQYELTVNAIDELTPVQSSTTVISVTPVFDWSKSDFRFNVPVYLKDSDIPLTNSIDAVVEQGTSDTWFYRKWDSGRVELYGYQNISDVECTVVLGNMYRTAVITPPSFPFTVYSPKTVATYESEGYGAFLWPTTLTTTAKPPNFYLVRPTSSEGITGKVNFHIQGSWK